VSLQIYVLQVDAVECSMRILYFSAAILPNPMPFRFRYCLSPWEDSQWGRNGLLVGLV
jgi:hypothetical protein